jgi:hypothetical protein
VKALGNNRDHLDYIRLKDLKFPSQGKQQGIHTIKVFDDGVNACDIKQGELGDCYLLSAMSVIAHSRPQLIQKIFHPASHTYCENGLYSIMFYRNRKPVVITIDDLFPAKPGTKAHAYV